jgi:hypothetical protein
MTGHRIEPGPRKLSAADEAEVERLYRETSLSCVEIGARYGLTGEQVRWMARRREWGRTVFVKAVPPAVLQDRLLTASLARDRRINGDDNPRAASAVRFPVPVGGFRMGR